MLTLLLLGLSAAIAGPTCKTTTGLSAQEGSFTDGSPKSDHYDNDAKLCWKIAPSCPDGGLVSLHFTRMDLEQGYDFVQVYDSEGALMSKAADTETTYTSSSFLVWFSSDASTTDTGFSASYSCELLDEEAVDEVIERPEEDRKTAVWRGTSG